jgi:hypothetical protein
MADVTQFHDTDIERITHPHCLPGLKNFLLYADICLRVATRPNGPAVRLTSIHKTVAVTVPIPSKASIQVAVDRCISPDWLVMSAWEPILGNEPF